MRSPPDRAKVVVRHLPPAMSQAAFAEKIDGRFGGRYSWLSFRPGKPSQKHQSHARAYINFIKPEDVFEFAEFFNGHVFVNEKGTQFKAIVEFAPCQCVPKQLPKKDEHEGTITKDPDYLEFLEAITKPVENLPSAEVQLDRRETERTGVAGDVPIITPLMNFVRQKRAAKNGSRRKMANGKHIKDARTFGSSSSASSRRGSEKGRVSSKMYVKRDSTSVSSKDKSTYTIIAKRDEELDKSVTTDDPSGTLGSADTGKKILLLKGKEKGIPLVSGSKSLQQSETSKSTVSSSTSRQNQQSKTSGKIIIRSILLNNDARQSQSSAAGHSEKQIASSYPERDRRPPRPQNFKSFVKDTTGGLEEKFYEKDMNDLPRDKQDRRPRHRDRPNRGVWAPLRHPDGSYASNEPLSSSNSQGPYKLYKHSGRKGMAHDVKESDVSLTMSEGKSFKRGGSSYSSHEKQAWVQKSSAGS